MLACQNVIPPPQLCPTLIYSRSSGALFFAELGHFPLNWKAAEVQPIHVEKDAPFASNRADCAARRTAPDATGAHLPCLL